MDVGFEKSGFKIVFANELDHDAVQTWKANRGNTGVMVEGNLTENLTLLKKYGSADVLFGGPPCQGFSVAGKMNPNDPRSRLIWSFLEAVEIVKPKVFVMENVKALGGLAKWESVRTRFLSHSKALGYNCFFKICNAADYGVPQNRERVVFVGVKEGTVENQQNFEAALADKTQKPSVVREVFNTLGSYGSEDNEKTCTANVSLAKHPVLRKSPYAGMLVNGAGRPMDMEGVSQTLPASMGGNKTPIVDQAVLDNPQSRNWFEEYHEALVRGDVSPQDTKVPNRVRRLTLTEAAALQTFPRGYVFCGKKTQQYKQIGNAVACDFAYVVAEALKESCA
jgi:DNA (cytosine-5)-methyltransferase 1